MLLQLTVLLLFCAVVRGMELKCDLICSGNSKTRRFDLCWQCDIKNQQISEPDQVIFVAPQFNNGTIADVERVNLNYGDVSRLPIIIHKTSGKQILLTELSRTNTRALNSQFFGNSGNNLKHFEIFGCDYLIVEAFAFKNCSNLEHLRLIANELTSIPPDAFRGLHKLISLHFSSNRLSLVVKGWFIDLDNLERLSLGGNQLVKIPDDSFESLTNLKELYLTNNKIEIITKNMFQHNEQLQKIGLSDNRINQIQSGTFAHLTQLTDLDVSKNICTNKTFINKTPEQISAALTACQPPTCVIPQIPNGSVISTNDNTTQTPGKSLETFFMVKVVCDPNFIQFHEKEIQTVNMCLKDDWKDEEWPECQRE